MFLKPMYRLCTYRDVVLDVICQNILLIGILGISGAEYKVWPTANYIIVGITSGFFARVFHFCYSILQVKQDKIPLEVITQTKRDFFI